MFVRTYCRASASGAVLACALLAAPAYAQSADGPAAAQAAEPDARAADIVVTGIRGSLDQAASIKRKADSIVDAISAEDVGKYPDVNVAESVQRITGVQINRTRGEGRTVNIRGLPSNFTLATLNGGSISNAINDVGRSFDFTVLPPEFIRTLAVYKSPTADLQEGGLAGIVDVRTAHPLEIGKRVITLAAQGEYETNSGQIAPRVSGFYSDVFAEGRLGVSVGLSYTRRKPSTQDAGMDWRTSTEKSGIPTGNGPDDLNGDGVIEPNLLVRMPGQVRFDDFHEDNQRYSAIASLQYRASDSLTFTLDGLYSKVDIEAVNNEFLNVFTNASTVVSSKVQTIEGVPTATDFRVADLDMRGGGRYEDRHGYLYNLTGGAKFEKNGWTAALQGSYGLSRQRLNNLNIAVIGNGEAEFKVAPGDAISSIYYYNGFDTGRLDPNRFRIASLNGNIDRNSRDQQWDVKGDVSHRFGDRGLTALRFGARYTKHSVDQDNKMLTITGAQMSALVGGLPAGPLAGTFSAARFMQLITPQSGDFLGSYNGDAHFASTWLASDTRGFLSNYSDAQLIAAGSLTNDATGITDQEERTLAGYARADFAFGRLSGNIGLRAVRTWQTTIGVSPDLTGITVAPDAGNITRIPAAGPLAVDRHYDDFLPSLNLKLEATDKLLFRFSASRTMARPNLGDISPTTTANGTARTITQNNPTLDPFRANNLDATAEWYFNRDGLIGASLFYKDLKSLITRQTFVQSYTVTYVRSDGLPSTKADLDFTVSKLVNGSGVSVKGFELYYQQAFKFLPAPFDGFGAVLNYTYIDNSDPTQLTAASKHNYNVTGYYEKGPVGARLSYSWRGGYLSGVALAPAMNTYTVPFGTLDGSINVKVTKNASIVLEAVNLLDRDERVRFGSGLPQNYVDSGRRIFAGVRLAL
jgi:iron complex outermembrane receptor protein